jgi:hypothetical protein
MKELYREVFIPNLEDIQKELMGCIPAVYKEKGNFAFNYTMTKFKEECPLFHKWINSVCKKIPKPLRFYIIAPNGETVPHIDGSLTEGPPFGINIPVLNCTNSTMFWYDCDLDNIAPENGGNKVYYSASHPIDREKMTVIGELELSKPHLIKNDIMHSVENYNNGHRIILAIRWPYADTISGEPGDVVFLEKIIKS